MYYLIYQSSALIPRNSGEHDAILIASYRCNKRDDITGFLHREQDYFVQYLEGPKDKIMDLMGRLEKDWRHENIDVLDEGKLNMRRLPDWQMGMVEQGTFAISDLLEIEDTKLAIKSADPFDLVVFMVANAGLLRQIFEPGTDVT
ncbi:BLUF domain-containing protein [Neptunicoccus sediminis]|uniref:BLUF domain-containing protein n=1 Tax=Neptunicoccus sediminis TaxID=1892596 RepID=UPI000845DB80|nr:BLUF domain-containing protein [Neptunicoccus sediminis]